MSDVATPRKFRKRPVEIEAVQLSSIGAMHRALAWMESCGGTGKVLTGVNASQDQLAVDTLEGPLAGNTGWWLIKGVKGEFYCCEPEIFGLTYDEVQAPAVEFAPAGTYFANPKTIVRPVSASGHATVPRD